MNIFDESMLIFTINKVNTVERFWKNDGHIGKNEDLYESYEKPAVIEF